MADEQDVQEPRKRSGILLAVVAAAVAASAGTAAGAVFLGPPVGEAMASDPTAQHEDRSPGGGEHDDETPAGPTMHLIDNLVVNPSGSGASRFLLASVALAPANHTPVAELEARDIELRDALLRLLGSRSVESLADIGARESLGEEILAEMNRVLGGEMVEGIYLPQFVLQ